MKEGEGGRRVEYLGKEGKERRIIIIIGAVMLSNQVIEGYIDE